MRSQTVVLSARKCVDWSHSQVWMVRPLASINSLKVDTPTFFSNVLQASKTAETTTIGHYKFSLEVIFGGFVVVVFMSFSCR